MNDIAEYIANVRYLMNEAISQVDNVHQLTSQSELDLETVLLNVTDVQAQMLIVNSELKDLAGTLEGLLKGEDDTDVCGRLSEIDPIERDLQRY